VKLTFQAWLATHDVFDVRFYIRGSVQIVSESERTISLVRSKCPVLDAIDWGRCKQSFAHKLSNKQEFEYMWPLISDLDLELWHEIF